VNYVQQNGDLTPLYVGKIAADHMPIIEELQFRKILVQPPLRPRYLDNPDAQARLTAMKDHSSVIDLLQS
jgi:hypothetical protein